MTTNERTSGSVGATMTYLIIGAILCAAVALVVADRLYGVNLIALFGGAPAITTEDAPLVQPPAAPAPRPQPRQPAQAAPAPQAQPAPTAAPLAPATGAVEMEPNKGGKVIEPKQDASAPPALAPAAGVVEVAPNTGGKATQPAAVMEPASAGKATEPNRGGKRVQP